MICQNCGTQNSDNSKFCIKCGTNLLPTMTQTVVNNLQSEQTQSVDTINVQSEQMMNATSIPQSSYNTSPNSMPTETANYGQSISNNNMNSQNMSIGDCFFFILAVILKPFTAFKEEKSKLDNFKNSAIISIMVSLVATIATLIKTMLNEVIVKKYDYWTSTTTTTWKWENLKELDYVQLIGKSFLVYIAIIAGISAIYYIASLIVKKQTRFERILGIIAVSVVPMIVCTFILSPLLSMIYAPLGMGITVIGLVYTVVLIYEEINEEISLSGNAKYYFNLICLSTILIAAYYVCMKFLMENIVGNLDNILGMFG